MKQDIDSNAPDYDARSTHDATRKAYTLASFNRYIREINKRMRNPK